MMMPLLKISAHAHYKPNLTQLNQTQTNYLFACDFCQYSF